MCACVCVLNALGTNIPSAISFICLKQLNYSTCKKYHGNRRRAGEQDKRNERQNIRAGKAVLTKYMKSLEQGQTDLNSLKYRNILLSLVYSSFPSSKCLMEGMLPLLCNPCMESGS